LHPNAIFFALVRQIHRAVFVFLSESHTLTIRQDVSIMTILLYKLPHSGLESSLSQASCWKVF